MIDSLCFKFIPRDVSLAYGEPVTFFGDQEHKRLDVPRAVLYNGFTRESQLPFSAIKSTNVWMCRARFYTMDSHELRRSRTGETPWLKVPIQ